MGAALALAALGGRTRADEPEPDARTAVDIALMGLATLPDSITSITTAGDSRLFLTLQHGKIMVFSGGSILPAPFLDVSSIVACCGERGLLSVAFHPQYFSNGFFFVYYTDVNGDIAIARYHCTNPATSNVADASGVVLLTIPHPNYANHNGGQLQFGPADAYLYFGTGDGGSGYDPPCNSQNDGVPLGKLLRIDVNQNVNTPPFYGIPPSNPQAGGPFPENVTWSKGLRNPWRFSFDAVTHDLWIGDVGQNNWEEIDHRPASSPGGENYGWKVMEATHCTNDTTNCTAPPACNSPAFTSPVFEYDHTAGNCSITGGYVYRGSQIAALQGTYVYGDYCSGRVWGLTGGSSTLFTPQQAGLQTFGQDSAGELYVGTGGGGFYRIVAGAATPTPTATRTFTPTGNPTPDPSARRTPVPPRERRPPTRELTPRPID